MNDSDKIEDLDRLHTASLIDTETIYEWLSGTVATPNPEYAHYVFATDQDVTEQMIPRLRRYFESAHRDARTAIHEMAGLDLHPLAPSGGAAPAAYPNNLPISALKGCFGEVFAGLVTEHFELTGKWDWWVPVFLHRNHSSAVYYLKRLRRGNPPAEIPGRGGDDFIALALDEDGIVVAVLVAEAKYRSYLPQSVCDDLVLGEKMPAKKTGTKKAKAKKAAAPDRKPGIYTQLSRAHAVPLDLSSIADILDEIAPTSYANTISSIRALELNLDAASIERVDLILLATANAGATKEKLPDEKPEQYDIPRMLVCVEVEIPDAESLIPELYAGLYEEE